MDLFERTKAILDEADAAAVVKPSESVKPFKPRIRMVGGTPHMSAADFRSLPGLKLKAGRQFTFGNSTPAPAAKATTPSVAKPLAEPLAPSAPSSATAAPAGDKDFILKPNGFKQYKDYTESPSGLKIYRYDSRANIQAEKAREAAKAAQPHPVQPKASTSSFVSKDPNAWLHVGRSTVTTPKPSVTKSEEPKAAPVTPTPNARERVSRLWHRLADDAKPAPTSQPKPAAAEAPKAEAPRSEESKTSDTGLNQMWHQYARNHNAEKYTRGVHLQNNDLFHKVADRYGLDTAKAMHGYAEAMRRGKMFDVTRKFGIDEAIGAGIPSAFKAPKPPGVGVRSAALAPPLKVKTSAPTVGSAPRSSLGTALRSKFTAPSATKPLGSKLGSALAPKTTAPKVKAIKTLKPASGAAGNIGEEDVITEAGRVKNLGRHSVKRGIFSARRKVYRDKIDVRPTDRDGRPDVGEGDERDHNARDSANESVGGQYKQYYGEFLEAVSPVRVAKD